MSQNKKLKSTLRQNIGMAQLNMCASSTAKQVVILEEIKVNNKLVFKNLQAKMDNSQKASKWKVVIKQTPSGLEGIRRLLPRY